MLAKIGRFTFYSNVALITIPLDFLLCKSKNPREYARLAVAESFIFNGAHVHTVHMKTNFDIMPYLYRLTARRRRGGEGREFTIARWNKQLTSVPFNWNPRLCLLIMSHCRRRRRGLVRHFQQITMFGDILLRSGRPVTVAGRQIATLPITWIALIHFVHFAECSCGSASRSFAR